MTSEVPIKKTPYIYIYIYVYSGVMRMTPTHIPGETQKTKPRRTAAVCVTMSSIVTGVVDEWPRTTLPRESPTRTMSTPFGETLHRGEGVRVMRENIGRYQCEIYSPFVQQFIASEMVINALISLWGLCVCVCCFKAGC